MRTLLCFLAAAILCALPARGQRVGVVMSGGGAKGLYHIGVIQALEENGIPIDYVAGTSMGSIIAAMYAAGYSPAQMREIVCSGAVKSWVSGRIDPNSIPLYRRNTAPPHFFAVRLNLRQSPDALVPATPVFQLPTALISSAQIDMAFAELFAGAGAAADGDFNRLMVPFLCVAADMNSRRPVVFRRGDLGEAVRASMSIPLAFKPVKADTMLLYDGGIYDNFPWRPLDRAFKPDFIIGSKCTAGNVPISEDSSLITQAVTLAMEQTDYRLPRRRSLMIERAVAVGMLDFSDPQTIIEAGYRDAIAQIPELKARIGRTARPSEVQLKRELFRASCPPIEIDRYEIEGLTAPQRTYVADLMNLRERSGRARVLDFPDFRERFFGVMASGDFQADFPTLHYDSLRARYGVQLRLSTRSDARAVVGGNISSTVFNQAFVGFEYHRIRRVSQWLTAGLYIGPIYTTARLGGRTNFFYLRKPFALSYAYNFAVKGFRHGSFGNLTKVDNVEQMKSSENYLSTDITMPLSHNSLLAVRLNTGIQSYRYYNASRLFFDADTDLTRLTFFGALAEVQRNTLDRQLLPRHGMKISASALFLGTRELHRPWGGSNSYAGYHWYGARVHGDQYFDIPFIRWFSLGLNLDALWSTHPRLRNQTATLISLPAYLPVVHSQMVFIPDLRARSYLAGGVMPTFDLMPNFFLRTGFYAMWRDRAGLPGAKTQYIAEASLVYHTPIGPVSLSLTKYNIKTWNNLYLTFNFGYTLFAPNGKFY